MLSAQDAPAIVGDEAPAVSAPRVGANEARASVVESGAAQWGLDRQIEVVGEDPYLRVTFDAFANELRTSFRLALFRFSPNERSSARQARNAWINPIRIEVWGRPSDIYRGEDIRLREVELLPDARFHLQMAVRLHDRFEEERFRIALIRVFVIEQMLAPLASQPYALPLEAIHPPEWIVYGFDELLEHRRGGRPSGFYSGMVRSGSILSPAELFATADPESLSPVERGLFRASAAAMVGALLEQDEGDVALRGFLGDLSFGSVREPAALLRQYFPAFREMEQGLERWWALQVASLAQRQTFEFMGAEETDRWLEEAITVRFEAGEGAAQEPARARGFLGRLGRQAATAPAAADLPAFAGTLLEHAAFLGRPGAEDKLSRCFDNLQYLRMTGHPLYRPVLERYEEVVLKLTRRQTRDLERELAEIAALRTTVLNTLRRSEDYLNYFEATQAPRRSEAFEGFLRLKRELEEGEPPRREDRITRYLDSLEREFR